MKRAWLLLTVVFSYLGQLQALPLSNPMDPAILREGIFFASCESPCVPFYKRWDLRMGYYGDFVYNRFLEMVRDGATVQQTRIVTNAGLISLGFCNRLDFFATLGASNIYIHTPGVVFGSVSDYTDVVTDTGFSWSIGAKWVVLSYCNWGLGIEGQYFVTRPLINYILEESTARSYVNERMRYSETQVGFGLTYRMLCFCDTELIPYIGGKWACIEVDSNNVSESAGSNTIFDMRENRSWGYAFGLTLASHNWVEITAEARFLAEIAFHLNTQFRF